MNPSTPRCDFTCSLSKHWAGLITRQEADAPTVASLLRRWTHLVSVGRVFSFRCRSELCWRRWRCVSHTETSGLCWDSSASCWWRPCRCWTRGPAASVGSGSWRWPPPSPWEVAGATEDKISAPAPSPECDAEDDRLLVQNGRHVWLVESTESKNVFWSTCSCLLSFHHIKPLQFRSTLTSSCLIFTCPESFNSAMLRT